MMERKRYRNMYEEFRRHSCYVCQCETWQKKIHAGFGALGWECGECGELIAFYHDEPLHVSETRHWKAIGENWTRPTEKKRSERKAQN